jgi:SnoaL-like domain
MSQEDVEAWRASLEDLRAANSESDREAWLTKAAELWDPEVELDAAEAVVMDLSGAARGIEAVLLWWRGWFAAWDTLQIEYELVDAGDRVVMLLDMRMRGRSSGVEVALGEHAWVSTFRDGLMIQSKLYMSQSEALKAAGLRE